MQAPAAGNLGYYVSVNTKQTTGPVRDCRTLLAAVDVTLAVAAVAAVCGLGWIVWILW